MTKLFSSPEKEIFKNEGVLYPDFVPEELNFRDNEIKEIVFSLKPLIAGKKALNLFIYGGTGTGKTVSAKHVSSQLMKETDKELYND